MDLKNKLETEKGKDAYPKAGVKLIYAGMCKNEIYMNDNGDDARKWWKENAIIGSYLGGCLQIQINTHQLVVLSEGAVV